MPHGVNYPLYVPSNLTDVRMLIKARRPIDALELLQSKAQFANSSAAALLAFVHLKAGAPRERYGAAVGYCKAAAVAGDPFAEFVLGHIYLTAGNTSEGHEWMRKSGNHLFPPALSHLGRMMARGEGYEKPDPKSALKMYRMAIGYGHVPTLVLVAKLLLFSRNPIKWLSGLVLFPFSFVAAAIFFHLAPFDVRVFVHVPGDWRPLFVDRS